ncbi:MAG: MFS transporter [Chloroflexi bacterium]|nr:MFS transporter [Chloroflexota bacterium]
MAGAAATVYFVQGGLGSYALGVLLPAWVNEEGWSRTAISVAYALSTLVPGLAGVIVGRWTDRHGSRRVICLGALLTGLSYLLLAGVNSFWLFFLAFSLGALGRAGMSQVPVSAAVARWFVERRGLAMGLAVSGISLAGVVLVPLVSWLVMTYGWRLSVVVLGVGIWLVVIPPVWLAMSGTPEQRGLRPYGADGPTTGSGRNAPRALVATPSLASAMAGPGFWVIAVALTLGHAGSNSIGLHALPALLDKGVSSPEAASAISLMAACSIAGKVLYGWLSDRFGSAPLLALAYLSQVGGFLLLALAGPGVGVWLFALLYGLSLGGTVTLQPTVVADRFGVVAYGAIYGAIALPQALVSSASPIVAGAVRELAGSYTPAFLAFATSSALGIIGMLLAFRLGRPAIPGSAPEPPV